MCVSGCLRCVGVSLILLAVVCMMCNILLLFPELNANFLLEGHVTREARWATGLWGSGLLVLLRARAFLQGSKATGFWAFRSQMVCHVFYSCVGLLGAGICCLVSATGLAQGPLCLYNSPSGPTWGVPLEPVPDLHSGYLYNRTMWSGVCLQPREVVLWNVVLFSAMGASSGLQVLVCAANIINSLLCLVLGRRFCRNKVGPVPV